MRLTRSLVVTDLDQTAPLSLLVRCSFCVHHPSATLYVDGNTTSCVPNLRWVNTRQPKSNYAGRPIELCTGVSTMNERNIHLAILLGPLAVIGAIVGYLRDASFY